MAKIQQGLPMTRTFLPMAFLTVPALGSVAMADDGTSLSAAQTSYTGATMLVGDEDVAFSSVGVKARPRQSTSARTAILLGIRSMQVQRIWMATQ